MDPLNPVSIGVDVGQQVDPTAVVVVEAVQVDRGRVRVKRHIAAGTNALGKYQQAHDEYERDLDTDYTIKFIERLPLRTGYPDVATFLADKVTADELQNRKRRLLIDITGVGRPVYEMLERELRSRPHAREIDLKPITFVHGDKYDATLGRMGKAFLVSRLQALLQGGHIKAPDTPMVRAMIEELRVYEIKVDDDGKDTYGAFKVGAHDDLATALGLAVLEDPFSDRVTLFKLPASWE